MLCYLFTIVVSTNYMNNYLQAELEHGLNHDKRLMSSVELYKAVFLFNRILRKRSIFLCFLGTKAELMTVKQ